jgi:hypothetical protein
MSKVSPGRSRRATFRGSLEKTAQSQTSTSRCNMPRGNRLWSCWFTLPISEATWISGTKKRGRAREERGIPPN